MTFSVIASLLIKSLLAGIVGSLDSIVMVVSNRRHLSEWSFIVRWACFSGLFHLLMKLIAGFVMTGSPTSQMLIAVAVRCVGLVAAIAVLAIAHREVIELDHHLSEKSEEEEAWNPTVLHLWLPAALVGSIDAYPIGQVKALLVQSTDPTKLIVGYLLGTATLVCCILLAAYLVIELEHHYVRHHQRVVAAGRLLHLAIFLALSQLLTLDIIATCMGTSVSAGFQWFIGCITAGVIYFHYLPHVRRWLIVRDHD